MSAIMTHIYNIDPSFDLTNVDSREAQHIWIATLTPEVEIQRRDFLDQEIADGRTQLMDFAMVLDKTARTYSRSREYVNFADAEIRKQFMDSVVCPDVGAPFVFTTSFVQDDAVLEEKGFITLVE